MADYYVSNTGNDASAGTTSANAWETLAKVSTATLSSGDTVSFLCGDSWRESLVVNGTGVTYQSYGSGDMPIFYGADVITGFSIYAGNIWRASLASSPWQVYFDTTVGVHESSSIGSISTDNEWKWATNWLYCYSTSSPETAFTAGGIQASIREKGVYASGKENVTCNNLRADQFKFGFYTDACDAFTLTSCNAWRNFRKGYYDATNRTAAHENIEVGYCDFRYNGELGAYHGGGKASSGATSYGNSAWFHHNFCDGNGMWHYCVSPDAAGEGGYWTGGIKLWGSGFGDKSKLGNSDGIVEYNVIHNSGPSGDNEMGSGIGLWLDESGSGNHLRYNYVTSSNSFGVVAEESDATWIYCNIAEGNGPSTNYVGNIGIWRHPEDCKTFNNVAIGPSYSGIVGHGSGTGNFHRNEFKNNISINHDRALYALRGAANVTSDGNNGSANVYTHNDFYSANVTLIRWHASNYSNISSWEVAYGATSYCVSTVADFVVGTGTDYRLNSTSPLINAGTAVSATADFNGVALGLFGGYDIGAFEYAPDISIEIPLAVVSVNATHTTATAGAATATFELSLLDFAATATQYHMEPVAYSTPAIALCAVSASAHCLNPFSPQMALNYRAGRRKGTDFLSLWHKVGR